MLWDLEFPLMSWSYLAFEFKVWNGKYESDPVHYWEIHASHCTSFSSEKNQTEAESKAAISFSSSENLCHGILSLEFH